MTWGDRPVSLDALADYTVLAALVAGVVAGVAYLAGWTGAPAVSLLAVAGGTAGMALVLGAFYEQRR